MITGRPDTAINLARLENEIQGFRREAAASNAWYFRERYIDRCRLDPFYILEFKDRVEEQGDDLFDEELFQTSSAPLRVVCMTRGRSGSDYSYWQQTDRSYLIERLDNFLTMFREDYLQPPGAKGELYNSRNRHEIFREKRFLFEVRSPRKGIIGTGPKKFAGLGIGAVRGQVTDENGAALAGAVVELIAGSETLARRTDENGLFWFSRVPPGRHRIRVRGAQSCLVQVIEQEWFGNVKGWLADQDGNPVENAEAKLIAPDAEEFPGWSNASGKFTTGPLPAFPYILRIPDHLFTVEKTVYVSDAVIGGVLKAQNGNVMPGQRVVLKQNGQVVKEATTDNQGRFLFDGLLAGRYRIEVPGIRIFMRRAAPGAIKGRIRSISETMMLELIAENRSVYKERTALDGRFNFEQIGPKLFNLNTQKYRA